MRALLLCVCALGAQAATEIAAAEGDWQTLTAQLAGGEKQCEMRVPAGWALQDKGASFNGEFAATLIFEAEQPDAWWNKRKQRDIPDSRKFLDSKTEYWIEVQGALISGGEDGAVHIGAVRNGDLVCHAVVEFKAEKWRENYMAWQERHADMVRTMMTSLKPM
jgi:hypothetical protein